MPLTKHLFLSTPTEKLQRLSQVETSSLKSGLVLQLYLSKVIS